MEAMTAIGRQTAMPLLGATLIAIIAFLPAVASKVSAMVAGVTPGAKLLSGRDIQRDLARMLFMLLKLHSRRLSLRKSAIRKLKRIRSARPFTGGNLTTMANLS
jgi:hypothetical protein